MEIMYYWPLLGGESSGTGARYEKAAALVDLAEDGIGLPEQIILDPQSNFQNARKFYFLFVRLGFIWFLNYFALIILNFLEKPLWCTNYSGTYSCDNRDYFYLGELPYLTGVESLVYEGITLIILVAHTFFPISYEGRQLYWKDPLNRLKVVCLIILEADILVYAIYLSPMTFDYLPFRLGPYIRVMLFMLNFRELRTTILILAKIFNYNLLIVLASGLLFLLFFTWLAYVIFEDTQEGTTEFTSFGTTLYQMFVLFTTSNNPDVWIPAYKESRWYCLFFIYYELLGGYVITNWILAIIYNSFKYQLATQGNEMDCKRKCILKKAFDLIDTENHGFIYKEQCIQLFKELNKYRTLPKISEDEYGLIFDKLDDDHDSKIDEEEFTGLCEDIYEKFQEVDYPSCLEKYPSFYRSRFSEKFKDFVKRPIFEYVICFILVQNLFADIVETTIDIENSSAQKVWQVVEFVFGWIYVLEMALKVYSFGFKNYWRAGKNRFDFLVTWLIVIGETLTFVYPEFLSNRDWIRYLLLAAMLRLIRLMMFVQQYDRLIATFLSLVPSLMPYLGTIFCVLCIYCSLGVQIFGGIVNAGNTSLEATGLYDNDYLLFNFNDYPNGMVTLFNLLVMGNWQIWIQSYVDLTGTSWTLTYFVSLYIITQLLLLNVVITFVVLRPFSDEMPTKSPGKSEEENKDADGEKDRRQTVGTKSFSQKIYACFHYIFSSKLPQSQSSNP